MKAYFVAGTGTDVGKTWISEALLWAARERGLRSMALKPIASGCEVTADGLRNGDALALQGAMSEPLCYEDINPVALEMPIAPHIAAARIGLELSARELASHCLDQLKRPHDFALIEGAGGWRVPLNQHETMADVAIGIGCPVILVVGMGLGCLSNALLTVEAIKADGLQLAGWIANSPQEEAMPFLAENLLTLDQRLDAPCLGRVPFVADARAAAHYLRLPDELE